MTSADPGNRSGRPPGASGGSGSAAAPGRSGPPGAGRVLSGRYRLDAVLGRGSMGTVWAATDQLLHRRVALKEINVPPGTGRYEQQQLANRTLREARAVASLSNPYVVTLFDILQPADGPVIVMELLDARALSQVLAEQGPLRDGTAATIGVAVASGLLAAHAVGITHRDVKPANVLICRDGRVKLTDFGIARGVQDQALTATGLLLGSPAYIAPEVAAGRRAIPQSDGWGLGALLYACLEGRPPFDRGEPIATLTAVVQDPVPPFPRAGRLAPVLAGLLVKDPRGRMPLADAVPMLRAVADDPSATMLRLGRPGPAGGPAAGGVPSHAAVTRAVPRPPGAFRPGPQSGLPAGAPVGPVGRVGGTVGQRPVDHRPGQRRPPDQAPVTERPPVPPAGGRPQPAGHHARHDTPLEAEPGVPQHVASPDGEARTALLPAGEPAAGPAGQHGRHRSGPTSAADPDPAPSPPWAPAAPGSSASQLGAPPPPWDREQAAGLSPLPVAGADAAAAGTGTGAADVGPDWSPGWQRLGRRRVILLAALIGVLVAVAGFLGIRAIGSGAAAETPVVPPVSSAAGVRPGPG
ncbi:serine/threonine-protein kinase [Nakamurella leprariae]|uniref:non-specific serine/threonine protein kinase n=1 Tax=Nakamurella leprariae TaxID=2803911 RepID=A0A939BZG0_9ACTN|nr:serine/threonine-protein kinase [Nakamurella leprariae]MBM9467666.1 protein kinase [Nakamurella leprariae]